MMADTKRKFPRRKVVSSYKSGSISSNWFTCKLECGHEVPCNGRVPRGQRYGQQVAPKTSECIKCYNEAKVNDNA